MGPNMVLLSTLVRGTIATAVAWVMATAALAQDRPPNGPSDPPLSIETVGLEPTVAKTGDLIKATFRVRFKDLVAEGKEILVLEDRMAADKLSLGSFEAVGLDVARRRRGDERIWDFVYRLRIVKPIKGIEILPSIGFYWLIRDLGQNIEDATVLQTETEPLQLRYVTTITEDPVLDVRDAVDLGSFTRRAVLFRGIAWIVAPLPMAVWVIAFVMGLRRPRPAAAMKWKAADASEAREETMPPPLTIRRARRMLRRQLRAVEDVSAVDGQVDLTVERDLVLALREYLRAELPDLNPGDTPKDIARHLEARLVPGQRKQLLAALAARLVTSQNALERGSRVVLSDPAEEAREIESLLRQIQLPARIVDRTKRFLGRS